MKRANRIVVVAALAIGIVACAKREGVVAESAAAPRALQTVRINVLPSMAYSPTTIGDMEGYFRDEGIKIRAVRIDANSALVSAVSGTLDVLLSPVRSGLFNAIARGAPLQIVADDGHLQPGPCSTNAFTAPPALAERVKRKGLRGQHVATIKGGITEFMITRLLASQQLTTADVHLVEYPSGEGVTGDLRVLDAVRLTYEPNLTVEKEKGLIGVVEPAEQVVPGLQRNVVMFGRRLLQEDPDLGRRFMRAWLRSVRRYNEGKTDGNVEIISRHTGLPEDLVRKVCWPVISSDGRIPEEAVQPLLDWSKKRGYLEADVPRSKWWNPTFIDEANRDLVGRSPAASTGTSR